MLKLTLHSHYCLLTIYFYYLYTEKKRKKKPLTLIGNKSKLQKRTESRARQTFSNVFGPIFIFETLLIRGWGKKKQAFSNISIVPNGFLSNSLKQFHTEWVCEIANLLPLFTMRTREFPSGCVAWPRFSFRSATFTTIIPSNCSDERKNTCLDLPLRCPFDVLSKKISKRQSACVSAVALVLHSGFNSWLFWSKFKTSWFFFRKK